MATEKSDTMKKRFKLAPPDGGYGYAIVLAASVNLMTATMFLVSFGMIFHDFFIKLQLGSTGISVLTGVKAVFLALSGFLTGPLAKIMSKRKLAFLGCLFFNAGGFGAVFVNTKIPFFICEGILQSTGSGFLMNVSYAIITDYFVNKRMLFMAFIHVMSCGSSMLAPILVTYCMTEYGYQGTLIIMSAIGVHSFVACALIQPVAWHMKKVSVTDDMPENMLLLQLESANNTVVNISSQKADLKQAVDVYVEKRLHREPITPSGVGKGVVGCNFFKRYVDWSLFRHYVLTSRGVGLPTTMFAEVTYMYFLPRALYTLGWDKHQVKWAFALFGFGDITCRAVIALFSGVLKKIGSHWLYLFGVSLIIATRLALLWVEDYTSTLAIVTVMGVSRSVMIVMSPLVIADYVGPDRFPSAVGISFMMYGLISIVFGPVIGAIADAAQSRAIMFEILIGLMVIVAVAWLFEIWWNKRLSSLQETIRK